MGEKVLIVSARMGAGHDGAARELRLRLEADGLTCQTKDFLDAAPWAGRLIKGVYELQLKIAPWAYEATYRVWFLGPFLCAPLAVLLGVVFGRRLRRWATELGASAVVSTYPLASVALGRLRRRRFRRLDVPAITFVTDFAVHPLWVHPGIDLNLCVHAGSAAEARRLTGRPARAPGPLVSARFRAGLPDRARARVELGLPPAAVIALVVAGSWGVGDVEATFDALVATGRYLPVVVCGNNQRLRRRLEAKRTGVVLGWTDAMATLMAASDVLVQNAGGLTCMEAFAAGLPVVSFRPIPGHGRQNALDMDRAGVAAFARVPSELTAVLDRVTGERGRMASAGTALFGGDAAEDVKAVVGASVPLAIPLAHPRRRRLAIAGVSVVALYAGTNLVADAATAHGIDVARLPANQAALVVRLGPGNLADPTLAPLLARDRITAAVEGNLARADPSDVRRLARAGVEVANAGWAPHPDLHLLLAGDDVSRSGHVIAQVLGYRPELYAPEAGVNGFDLAFARARHERIVRGVLVRAAQPIAGRLVGGRVYVLDADTMSGPQLERRLDQVHAALASSHLTTASLAGLR